MAGLGEAADVPGLAEVTPLVGGDGVEPFAPERAQGGHLSFWGQSQNRLEKKGGAPLAIALRRISR